MVSGAPSHTLDNRLLATDWIHATGLILVASVDDQQVKELGELKQQIRQVVKRITPSSEPRASIESKQYTMQYDTTSHDEHDTTS